MLRQMWMALASYFAVAFGDAEPGSTTSSSTMMLDTGTDCNPYQGTRYITLGNGDSVTSTVCKDSWDLYEVAVYDDQNQEITGVTATAPTGSAPPNTGYGGDYEPYQALDGSLTTYWAGDRDIGMSCSCWHASKKDAQQLLLDLGSSQKVSKINIWQGGAGNKWAVSRLRIHCHSAQLNANPLELEISSGSTTIECDDVGCRATGHNPTFVNRSAACVASKAGHNGVPVGLLLGLGLASACCW
ncbi:unnamed protein product [Effrenium voratum]|nr:unnamed protein product [Effrenium voratum]